MPMTGNMTSWVLLNVLVWVLVIGVAVIALWRGMQAQERMARHLEEIARSLSQRPAA